MEDPSKEPVNESTARGGDESEDSGWCQPKPVDNCCCCIPLRAGVAIIAAISLLYGISEPIYFPWNISNEELDLDEALRICHENQPGPGPHDHEPGHPCPEADRISNTLELERTLFPVAMLIGGLYLVSGVLGLYAVWKECPKAALFFTVAQVLVVIVECMVSAWGTMNNAPTADLGSTFIGFFFSLYFALVSWSYFTSLKKNDVVDEETPLK